MIAKKKPDLAVVIGMGKPKGGGEEKSSDPDGDESAHEDAMAAFNEAKDKGDLTRQVEAFRTLYDLCKSEHSDEGEDYEEEK